MNVPEEFQRLTRCFWNGSHRDAATPEQWIARAAGLNSPEQLAVCRAFLNELLVQADVEELQLAWRSGGCSYGLPDDKIRGFLEKVRDLI